MWVFYAAVWKSSCHIWGQHFQICLILKFHATIKISNFGTKNPLGIFGPEFENDYIIFENNALEVVYLQTSVMPYLGILSCYFEELLSYFKSVLFNLSYCKVCSKNKNP